MSSKKRFVHPTKKFDKEIELQLLELEILKQAPYEMLAPIYELENFTAYSEYVHLCDGDNYLDYEDPKWMDIFYGWEEANYKGEVSFQEFLDSYNCNFK